jgi:hypothetical protein
MKAPLTFRHQPLSVVAAVAIAAMTMALSVSLNTPAVAAPAEQSIPSGYIPAGGFCIEPWCGDVDNRSRTPNAVRIAGCWHNGDITEWFGEYLPCEPQSELGWGDDGDNYYADVDAFRARGGCFTAWSTRAGSEYHEWREGLGSKWIRVEAGTNVIVLDVRC